MIEVRIIPERWRKLFNLAEELTVFEVSYLARGELECINPHAVDGTFVVLSLLRAHRKPALRDADERRLTDALRQSWLCDGRHRLQCTGGLVCGEHNQPSIRTCASSTGKVSADSICSARRVAKVTGVLDSGKKWTG